MLCYPSPFLTHDDNLIFRSSPIPMTRSSPILNSTRSLKRQHPNNALVPNSSDTEEDTQGFLFLLRFEKSHFSSFPESSHIAHEQVSVPMFKIPAAPIPKSITNPKHIVPAVSSDTEDDSQSSFLHVIFLFPVLTFFQCRFQQQQCQPQRPIPPQL